MGPRRLYQDDQIECIETQRIGRRSSVWVVSLDPRTTALGAWSPGLSCSSRNPPDVATRDLMTRSVWKRASTLGRNGVARRRQKLDQAAELRFGHASEELPVHLEHGLIQSIEQRQPLGSDPRRNEPSGFGATLALDEFRRLEPIEQTRDIGNLRHQPVSNSVAAEPAGTGTATNPPHVVLGRGDAERFQSLRERVAEHRRRALEVEMRFCLEALRTGRFCLICSEGRELYV